MTGWLLTIVASYVIGSIPFGVLIGRARGIDIRTVGSRNIGATNVGRVLGRRLGAVCLVLDMLKGAVPVLGAGFIHGVIGQSTRTIDAVDMWLWLAVAAAAVAGHMASIFLRFAGGKGVATSFGTMLAMWPVLSWPAIGALVVWYATMRLSRYVSVASMVSAVSIPIWLLISVVPPDARNIADALVHAAPPLIVTTALAVLVIWRHRANIGRLRRGEEPRTGRTEQSNTTA